MRETELKYKYDLTREAYKRFSHIDFFSDKKLDVIAVENGIVLPPRKSNREKSALWGNGGVLDSEGEYIEISAQKAGNQFDLATRNRVYGSYKVDGEVPYIDKEVFYLNFFIKQWGHFLIDVIGRLWYVLDKRDIYIIYTVEKNNDFEINGNYLELLTLLGIHPDKLIKIDKPTKFKRILVADTSIQACSYYTKEFLEIINTVKKNIDFGFEKKYKKIYCSRKNLLFAQKREIGEDWLEKFYNDNGYTTYCFEQLNVREQIRILNQADEVVMLAGSLQHNLIFANEKLRATLLMKSSKDVILQHMVNQIFGGEVCSVDLFACPLPVTSGGPFWFVPSNRFQTYCKDKGLHMIKIQKGRVIRIKDKLDYYYRYMKLNYKGILDGTVMDECPNTYRQLRQQYKKIMKALD